MKATPTRLPEGQGALVVPDPQSGKELLLTETGFRTLRTVLANEVGASRIASGSLLAGALVCMLGASSVVTPLVPLLMMPLAFLAGSFWGRASFARKLERLSRGQIPRQAVLGGGKRELVTAGLALALLLLPPMNPALGLTLFLATAAAAIWSYGRRSNRLAEEVTGAFEHPDLVESARLLEDPGELEILGQGSPTSGRCPVCGDELGGPGTSVRCEVCRTAHHPECWSYAGGRCSVYGCAGDQVMLDGLDEAV